MPVSYTHLEITVWLPWVGNLRLDGPPENLEFYVMKSFHNFTEGTAKVYEFEDKLRYLDNLRKSLHAGDVYKRQGKYSLAIFDT